MFLIFASDHSRYVTCSHNFILCYRPNLFWSAVGHTLPCSNIRQGTAGAFLHFRCPLCTLVVHYNFNLQIFCWCCSLTAPCIQNVWPLNCFQSSAIFTERQTIYLIYLESTRFTHTPPCGKFLYKLTPIVIYSTRRTIFFFFEKGFKYFVAFGAFLCPFEVWKFLFIVLSTFFRNES